MNQEIHDAFKTLIIDALSEEYSDGAAKPMMWVHKPEFFYPTLRVPTIDGDVYLDFEEANPGFVRCRLFKYKPANPAICDFIFHFDKLDFDHLMSNVEDNPLFQSYERIKQSFDLSKERFIANTLNKIVQMRT